MSMPIIESPRSTYQPQLPVVLVLDTSGSMEARIDQLKEGMRYIIKSIKADEVAFERVQLSVIEFNDNAKTLQPYRNVNDFVVPNIDAGGVTNYVAAIEEAIRNVTKKKEQFRQHNQQFYRPFVVFVTDGAPTNSEEELTIVKEKLLKEEREKHLVFATFGIDDADMNFLHTFTQGLKFPAQKIKNDSFDGFFEWLSASMEAIVNKPVGSINDITPEGLGVANPYENVQF